MKAEEELLGEEAMAEFDESIYDAEIKKEEADAETKTDSREFIWNEEPPSTQDAVWDAK